MPEPGEKRRADTRCSEMQDPKAPELFTTDAPTVPGTLDAHSRPARPARAVLRARAASMQPASAWTRTWPSVSAGADVKLPPDVFTTRPSTPSSAMIMFEPVPRIRQGTL